MQAGKNDIISQLQKELLPLQGFKPPAGTGTAMGLGALETAFPNGCFPRAGIHEFIPANTEHTAATHGFIAGLLGTLMQQGGACLWISTARTLFPPALKGFGVTPDQIIFVDLTREKDVLWVMEEALKCEGLAAVIGEVKEISLTASRRLQLAVEQSRVTGFVLRHAARNLNTIACVARWQVTPLAGKPVNDMPGVSYPRWNVQLLKIRNGKPGSWQLEWSGGSFQPIAQPVTALPPLHMRKTG